MRTAVPIALLAFAAPAAAAVPSSPPTASPRAAPAVHEAYAPALVEARARGVPLLVDVWAPW